MAEPKTAAEFSEEIENLKACLMVLDATIYCILPFAKSPGIELMAGQIAAAKETYEKATGQESMIGFTRTKTQEKT